MTLLAVFKFFVVFGAIITMILCAFCTFLSERLPANSVGRVKVDNLYKRFCVICYVFLLIIWLVY